MNGPGKSGLRMLSTLTLIVTLVAGQACDAQHKRTPGGYDLEAAPHAVKLGKNLKEISGLASDAQGRLFAHNDERGVVYQLDPMTGSVLSWFVLGRTMVHEDFEGLAIAGSYFYLVTSSGDLYQFREGAEGGRVEYRVSRTPLDRDNDVEGLCYDPQTQALLLACKGDAGKGYKGKRAVYSFDLKKERLGRTPRFLLDEDDLRGILRGKEFRPSAIERHPDTGHFFILASQGDAIIELSPSGEVLAGRRLAQGRHAQPEGLTFLFDGTMVISDEGKKHGALSLYARPKGR